MKPKPTTPQILKRLTRKIARHDRQIRALDAVLSQIDRRLGDLEKR